MFSVCTWISLKEGEERERFHKSLGKYVVGMRVWVVLVRSEGGGLCIWEWIGAAREVEAGSE